MRLRFGAGLVTGGGFAGAGRVPGASGLIRCWWQGGRPFTSEVINMVVRASPVEPLEEYGGQSVDVQKLGHFPTCSDGLCLINIKGGKVHRDLYIGQL